MALEGPATGDGAMDSRGEEGEEEEGPLDCRSVEPRELRDPRS